MRRSLMVAYLGLALVGCSKSGNTVAKGPVSPAPAVTGAARQSAALQIAYSYTFGFQVPAGHVAEVQAQHVALCDHLGPRCHVVAMNQASGWRDDAVADMELTVAADAARAFGDAMVAAVARAGGKTSGRTIQGEDLSKQIVDVEARLRGRQALADRLLQVVQTHQGSIADLVAAEKALADVQQEIDTARAELIGAQDRVAMSTIRVNYSGSAGLSGLMAPISDSFANMGSIAGTSFAALLSLLAALLPWAIPIGLIVFAARWWTRRRASHDD